MRTSVEPISDIRSFLDEWRRLYSRSDARFFLSPGWIESLLASGSLDRFKALRVYDDLKGVYALALISGPERGIFHPWHVARLNESGIAALDRIHIEYNDVLAMRDAPQEVRTAAVAAIIDALPGADQLVFRNVRPEMRAAIGDVCAQRFFDVETLSAQQTFEIRLESGTRRHALLSLSASLQRKIRRSIRRYEERGPLMLSRASSAPERVVAWTELMRLHAETWARRGKSGVFQEPRFRAFHESLIAASPNNVDFVRLTCGGETLAVLYNFVEGARAYNYQSGIRYEADNQLAPGFMAHILAAESYSEDGIAAYDLLAGEADYKRRLGVEGEILSTISVTRRNFRSLARAAIKKLVRHQGA